MKVQIVMLALAVLGCHTPEADEPQQPRHELPLGPEPGPNAEMRIHLIDIGQGAATLIEFSCGVVLVDTGGESADHFNSEARLISYLDRFFKVRPQLHSTISLLVLTHPHIDHTRGGPAVMKRYKVLNLVTDGITTSSGGEQAADTLAAGRRRNVAIEAVSAHDIPPQGLHDSVIDPISCPDGDPDIRAFWGAVRSRDVAWDHDALDNMNNDSVVMRFRLGAATFLITGDLEQAGIGEIVKRFAPELRATVWQVGHHGSWNATTKPLLDAIRPRVALISMGPANREDSWTAWAYGHPRLETIELLEAALTGDKREPIRVQVGIGAKQFVDRDISAPIYATGWDGDVRLTLRADGSETVHLRNHAPQPRDVPDNY